MVSPDIFWDQARARGEPFLPSAADQDVVSEAGPGGLYGAGQRKLYANGDALFRRARDRRLVGVLSATASAFDLARQGLIGYSPFRWGKPHPTAAYQSFIS